MGEDDVRFVVVVTFFLFSLDYKTSFSVITESISGITNWILPIFYIAAVLNFVLTSFNIFLILIFVNVLYS